MVKVLFIYLVMNIFLFLMISGCNEKIDLENPGDSVDKKVVFDLSSWTGAYDISIQGTHGVCSIEGSDLIYLPNDENFSGTDTCRFRYLSGGCAYDVNFDYSIATPTATLGGGGCG